MTYNRLDKMNLVSTRCQIIKRFKNKRYLFKASSRQLEKLKTNNMIDSLQNALDYCSQNDYTKVDYHKSCGKYK